VEGALFGGFGTAGQRCTSLGTVLVHESVHDAFVAAFARRSAAADRRPAQDVLYGPMLSSGSPSGTSPIWTGSVRAPGARLDRRRPDHRRQPAGGFVGDPRPGSTTTR
jgi:aldehyde dehydrogenase (NAD+)